MKLNFWKFIPLALFLLLIIFFWKGLSLKPQEIPYTKIGKKLPSILLPNLLIGSEQLELPTNIHKQYALVNIWASWCEACAEEQTFLLQLSTSGVEIYGINYKDNVDSANNWLKNWGNPFVTIGMDADGLTSLNLGVYACPETFLLDKNGTIYYRHTGILDKSVWESKFIPLIKQLESTTHHEVS